MLCPLHLPVFGHRDFEKLLRRARRIGDGVGTGGDRGLDALVRAATGRDDWDIREVLSDTSDDIASRRRAILVLIMIESSVQRSLCF